MLRNACFRVRIIGFSFFFHRSQLNRSQIILNHTNVTFHGINLWFEKQTKIILPKALKFMVFPLGIDTKILNYVIILKLFFALSTIPTSLEYQCISDVTWEIISRNKINSNVLLKQWSQIWQLINQYGIIRQYPGTLTKVYAICGTLLCTVKPRKRLNIQVGQVSSDTCIAAAINGQVSSHFAAAKKMLS